MWSQFSFILSLKKLDFWEISGLKNHPNQKWICMQMQFAWQEISRLFMSTESSLITITNFVSNSLYRVGTLYFQITYLDRGVMKLDGYRLVYISYFGQIPWIFWWLRFYFFWTSLQVFWLWWLGLYFCLIKKCSR